MRISAREFAGIGTGLRVWCPIGIAFQRNGGHGDGRSLSKLLFQFVILWLAFGQTEPPAIIMDHDADMIRIVEGRGAALEGGLVEVPFRRSELPDELRKVTPVLVVAGSAAFRGEVILVPPLVLRLRWQSNTGTTTGAQPVVATVSCRLAGYR